MFKEILKRFSGPAMTPTSSVAPTAGFNDNTYESLYEKLGKRYSDDDVIGVGGFDLIGRIELGVLLMEGLRPTDTFLDFGCGTGRLAVHAIPALAGGHYVGVDVSPSMLAKAQTRLSRVMAAPPCRISWVHQTTTRFPFDDHSVDVIGAFSVFTHIEHEDSYLYLKDALRVIKPRGRFVFSCLPMNLKSAHDVFLGEAAYDHRRRWQKVRNVTTSTELMTDIARLAGWNVLRWYAGDQSNIKLPDREEWHALGQSTCVLEAP